MKKKKSGPLKTEDTDIARPNTRPSQENDSGRMHHSSEPVKETKTENSFSIPAQRQSKSVSIKGIMAEEEPRNTPELKKQEEEAVRTDSPVKQEFTKAAFEKAWSGFLDSVKDEGTRIVSMFKSVIPELDSEMKLKLHLSNSDQKDTFILHYKHRLIAFMEGRFNISGFDIESVVDEADTKEMLYTDEQKLSFLTNKYPILKEVKKTFNLDIV